MKHNTTIIEVLIGSTLVVTLIVAIRSFLVAKEPAGAGAGFAGLGDIEGALKKILEQASHVPTAGVVAAAGASEDSQKLVAEIDKLKSDLEARQKTIEELKAAGPGESAGAGASTAGGLSEDERAKLEAQLKELQGKLSEYEIISEDIADLSFYKEQNAKLAKELEALKSGAGAPAAAPTAPPPAPASVAPPAPPKEEPAIVGKTRTAEPAPAAPPVEPTVPVAPPEAPVATNNVVDNDLMAEFNDAVVKQQGSDPNGTESAETSVAAAPVEEAAVDLGAMDVDKMMAEAASIKVADGPEISAEQALGAGLDENKLLQEATALQGVTAEDKKLMGQFENFVKKNE